MVVCTEKVTNGDFEALTGWSRPISVAQAAYVATPVHGGAQAMRLGITTAMENAWSWSSVQQTVTIPANATEARLRFWWWRGTEEETLSAVAAQALLPQASATSGGVTVRSALTYDQDLQELMLLDGSNPQWR